MESACAIGNSAAANMRCAMTAPSLPTAPKAMRLSLVYQLALLLVAAVLLAVTVLGGVVAWNLRVGFSDYVRAQEADWLERFAAAAASAVAAQGLGAIEGPRSLRPLFDGLSPRGPAPGRPPQPDDDLRPPRPGPAGQPGPSRPPGPPGQPSPPGPGGTQRLSDRISVVDAQGQPLSGRPIADSALAAQRAIVVNGQTVAYARLAQGVVGRPEVDAAFLARQYRGILFTAAALALLALVSALWVGRRWLRPVQQAQQAARRIAQGELGTRLVPQGDDELADLAHDINAMAASLQQLEASRRRWIAELSHEMRTPLAVLRGEVECLVDGVRPLSHSALLSLQEEVARLTRLVEDFHQLALSDLRALPCVFAPVQPRQLLDDAVARVAARARAAGLQISVAPGAATPAAHWDTERIGQLLSNLLENSLRYTDAPGQVALNLEVSAGAKIDITVDDGAPGVPMADAQRLFDPLYRADPSRSRHSGGSGLGLAICRAIVHSHGGSIVAGPSPLGGLRVVATLPLFPPAAA